MNYRWIGSSSVFTAADVSTITDAGKRFFLRISPLTPITGRLPFRVHGHWNVQKQQLSLCSVRDSSSICFNVPLKEPFLSPMLLKCHSWRQMNQPLTARIPTHLLTWSLKDQQILSQHGEWRLERAVQSHTEGSALKTVTTEGRIDQTWSEWYKNIQMMSQVQVCSL